MWLQRSLILTTTLCCFPAFSGVDTLLKCLSLSIANRQQDIMDKQTLHNQLRLVPPQAATEAEDPLQQQSPQKQQQWQDDISSQVSSPPPGSTDPVADAVHTTRREGSSGSRTQLNAQGKHEVTLSSRGPAASGSSSSSKKVGHPAGLRAGSNEAGGAQSVVHTVHDSRQQSPQSLRPWQSSEPGAQGAKKAPGIVAEDLTSLDQQKKKQQQRPQQRPALQPLQGWRVHSS